MGWDWVDEGGVKVKGKGEGTTSMVAGLGLCVRLR